MFLAVMTSALLAATPFSVTIEPLGFSARSDGEQVTVEKVKKGSVAAKVGLAPGMRIERINSPMRLFARKPITELNETDLHDALMPAWEEPLWLTVRVGEKQAEMQLARKDRPPAEEFPVIPLPPEQLLRLTPRQHARYMARLGSYYNSDSEPQPKPALRLEQGATAHVVGGKLKEVDGGGATPAWVYARATLDANCQRTLEKVVLRGTTPGLPRTFTRKPGFAEYNARFEVDLPLWKPAAVTRACTSKTSSLTVPLVADMYCKGVPVQKTKLTATLAVECKQEPAPGDEDLRGDFSLLVLERPGDTLRPGQLAVGAKGNVELRVYLGNVIPRPSEATLVELDAKGKVSRRFGKEKVPEDESSDQTFQVELDTKEPRTVRLALEVRFPDGSVVLGPPEEVEVVTPEQVAEERRQIEEAHERMQSFQRKLLDARKDPCEKIEATVAWLKAQPEIEWASGDGSHSFSYQVKGALAPLIFSCHSP
ncbi:PDZ domain-containing protein [Pyxidicoccus xibeiensis]|uniref:PDZ domain-containing protein n=1 Tax=Pyxidicoccus xibeiensis TaxID=2906759 RepID=UPI0020A7E00F|nr:PDZ domain-containing protein [Pyxidicoccus xibeiensis]MCP3144128.1 PDZ domain-containing protein [Pyxidicoccus xibeiensis]